MNNIAIHQKDFILSRKVYRPEKHACEELEADFTLGLIVLKRIYGINAYDIGSGQNTEQD
jgi:hypothetical protein